MKNTVTTIAYDHYDKSDNIYSVVASIEGDNDVTFNAMYFNGDVYDVADIYKAENRDIRQTLEEKALDCAWEPQKEVWFPVQGQNSQILSRLLSDCINDPSSIVWKELQTIEEEVLQIQKIAA